jgi:hypothetical protein
MTPPRPTASGIESRVSLSPSTYDAHGIDNPAPRAPMVVWSALYPALKGMRWQQLRKAASS